MCALAHISSQFRVRILCSPRCPSPPPHFQLFSSPAPVEVGIINAVACLYPSPRPTRDLAGDKDE